ncbi:RHS repeat-associated core domain-containing protein [Streptomyces ipomoeae]|uniref:RHS repeat-associated core domain-containing protein n=1 Tax=Streptomyces ipomoeae TaxID=103232 RepID=UPI00215CDCE0|nr:RHS repeat-associated core domain-containing protein [Streptomyces ipomoeae]
MKNRGRLPGTATVVLALLLSGLQPLLVRDGPDGPNGGERISADSSVTTIDRSEVRPGERPRLTPAATDGRPLGETTGAARVDWPEPGTATLAVPDRGERAAGKGIDLAVAAPRTKIAKANAPERIRLTALGPDTARDLGGHATAFIVKATDTKASGAETDAPESDPEAPESDLKTSKAPEAPKAPDAPEKGSAPSVGIRVDTSGFADAFGGNFESRLRLVAKPAICAENPDAERCERGTPVPSRIDLTSHTLSADVPVTEATVYVIAAAPNGETGSATATKLSSSSKWQVGLQSGDFSWSLPLPQVPAIAGDAPDISLGYSSQAVDGMVAAENNQPSWVGQGWDLALPYIERRYNGCADDGGDTGDLCWAGEHYMISLKGTSSTLVKDTAAGGDTWRAQEDPGWRIQRKTGAENGDNDGEYWVVTTPEGTRYTFGRGEQATTGTATDSVYTVPVFGDDEGEPCHAGSVEDSYCTQAWRWNLDGVVDTHGNSNTYFYERETNRYARNGDPDKSTSYVRGGRLKDIVYSQRSGAEDQQAPARLHFTTQLRCVEAADGTGECPAFDADHASSYPDAPLDSLCASGDCTGEDQKSPTFFTSALLRSVTAQRSNADGGWTDVDRLDFTYAYPEPSDGTSAMLWLEKVQQTGLAGDGELKLPAVEFTGKEYANRADADPEAGAPEMRKLRITSVVDELGRRVDVTYGQPDPCPVDDLPEGRFDSNTQDCFPGWRTNGEDSGFGVWHKYLTTKVTVRDTGGGSPPQTTEYRYRGTPAWHHDDDPVTEAERRSWSDWRGYGSVDVVKMTDPGYRGEDTSRAVQITRTLHFRGMDGDRKADGSTKSVEVTDSRGTSLKDLPHLRGKERESIQYQVSPTGAIEYELGGTLHNYTSARTTPAQEGETDPDKDAHLVVENDSETRETVTSEAGERTSRSTRLRTTYDTYGQVTSVLDTAGSDVRCTKTSYDRGAATTDAWMLAFPYRVRTYSGSCDDPKSLITGKDQYYDGSDELGAPVAKGDVTRTVSAVRASGPDTVTESVTTRAEFDAYGRTISETDGRDNTERTTYSPATGRPETVTETNALGHTEVTTLEPDRQQPSAVRDANGETTRNTYDPLGRLLGVRQPEQGADDPPAQVFAYFLDPEHRKGPRVTTRQLQSGDTYVTEWTFLDSLGRDRQTQQVSPASTSGNEKTVVTDTRYDDVGNIVAESLPLVADGPAGSALLAVAEGEADETRHTHDSLGRIVRSTQYGQGKALWSSTVSYFGDHSRTTPPEGGVTTTAWTDARGRVVRNQEGVGADAVVTEYTYTPADQVASVEDPGGHVSTYAYDLLARRVLSDDADAGRTKTRYDANGNPVSVWNATSLEAGDDAKPTLSTVYDELNRPVSRWEGEPETGKKIAGWAYDKASVPGGIGREASQTTHKDGKDYTLAVTGYDARGRITGRAWTFPAGVGGALHQRTYRVGYGYDAADNVVSLDYPDAVLGTPAEKITTTYDPLGNPDRLSGVLKDPLTGDEKTRSYISNTDYAADGKLAGRDYDDAHHPLRRAYAYEDDTQRLSRIQTLVGGAHDDEMEAKQDDTYRWDPAGNLTSVTDTALPKPVATCFTYDSLGRLGHGWTTHRTDCSDEDSTLTHDGPAGFNKSWTYTDDGNVASVRSLHKTREYAYEDADHPHAVTGVDHDSFAYDANGALTKKVKALVPTTLKWDAQQRLESSTTALLKKTEFVYSPGGQRLVRTDPAGVATLYIDGQEITVALGIAKGTRYYAVDGSTVAERLPSGILKWQFNDTQGSAQIAVPEGTGLVERSYWDPYGELRDLSLPPPTDRGWLGKVKDTSTGLNHLGARYYDADLGRFVSPDPAYDGSSAQTANAYSYGANNPVMYVDPTGLWSLSGAWNAVKEGASKAWDWANENKGLIANVAVGIGVGIAVGAVCATGVGCLVLAGAAAGAAGAAAGYGVDVAEGKQDFSWGGLAANVGMGAAFGAATAGAGAALGAGARALGNTAFGQVVKAGVAKAASTVTGAVAQGGRAVANAARAAGGKVADAAKAASAKVVAGVKKVTSRGPKRPANTVPAYAGGKTSGTLVRPDGSEVPLISGQHPPGWTMPKGTPGMNRVTKSHVEAHAAATMRNEGLTSATLWINRAPCQAGKLTGCD